MQPAPRPHRIVIVGGGACVRADADAAAGNPTGVAIVIIVAGATGVELAAEIRQATSAHAVYGLPHLDATRDIHITLLEAAPRILPPLSEALATAAAELLARLDAAVRTDRRVTAVVPGEVQTRGREAFRADLIVWAAGIKAPVWLASLDGLEANRTNQLVVRPTLQTSHDSDIFALGDCAACPWLGGVAGALLPPRAQVAHQQATFLVKSMAARLDGRALPVFHFRDFGSLVSFGELSAVGSLMGGLIGGSLFIQGAIARLMYAALYKLHQISIHGVLRVALDTVGRFLRGRVEPRVKLH